jgi:hypothetical protein
MNLRQLSLNSPEDMGLYKIHNAKFSERESAAVKSRRESSHVIKSPLANRGKNAVQSHLAYKT